MGRQMTRFLNALAALLFGLGILVFAVGLFSDRLGWQTGLICMVAFWVAAFALRVFLVSKND